MKKMFVLCVLCAVVVAAYSQDYDEIGQLLGKKDASESVIVTTDSFTTVSRTDVRDDEGDIPDSTYIAFLMRYGDYDISYATLRFSIPTTILDNYLIGKRCTTAGWATFITGAVLTTIGGIITGAAKEKQSAGAAKAGTAFMSIGGISVGVSLPLLTFGDHIKRETNKDLKLWMLRR